MVTGAWQAASACPDNLGHAAKHHDFCPPRKGFDEAHRHVRRCGGAAMGGAYRLPGLACAARRWALAAGFGPGAGQWRCGHGPGLGGVRRLVVGDAAGHAGAGLAASAACVFGLAAYGVCAGRAALAQPFGDVGALFICPLGAIASAAALAAGYAARLAKHPRPLGPGLGAGAGVQRDAFFAVVRLGAVAAPRPGAALAPRDGAGPHLGLQRTQGLVAGGLAPACAAFGRAAAGGGDVQRLGD